MIFNMRSLYICVKDMKRAVDFYEELLEMKIAVYDEIYSVFDINGFRFGLFAYEKMNEIHTFGSNCLPSLDVSSVDILKKKLENLDVVFPLTKIGQNYVAEFKDSEGNHIEITAPI